MHATGKELRRALFSLKQLFQDDKDLVHAFVSTPISSTAAAVSNQQPATSSITGLDCLLKLGADANDHNYQIYVLRGTVQFSTRCSAYSSGQAGHVR